MKAPLRKVVGWVEVDTGAMMYGKPVKVWRQKLECGHLKLEGRDIYGPTNAERRRCHKCAAEAVELTGGA